MIEITKLSESYFRVQSTTMIEQEIKDFFTFKVPGYQFSPKFKARLWDGNISLYDSRSRKLPCGLLRSLEKFASESEYPIEFRPNERFSAMENFDDVSFDEVKDFVDSLDLTSRGKRIEVRDYQYEAIWKAVRNPKITLVSPTSCLDGDEELELYLSDDDYAKFLALDNICYAQSSSMNKVKLKIKDLGKVLSVGISPKIDSPYGKVHITDSYVKYGIGYDMHLSNGEVVRCAENHKMLGLDDFVDAKDYSVGDFFHGGDVFLEKKTDVGYQDWYDFSVDHEQESYTHKGIVHHNSGKSLIIYCLIRWILDTNPDNRLVLIVPNVQLVEQMYADFQDYSGINDFDVSKAFQRLYAGKSKNVVAPVLISTWQSLSSIIKATDASILTSFTGVIVDEAHGATGKELQKILEQMTNASYRIGTTGTIQSEKVHKLVVEGFLGPSYQVITTKKLIDNKQVSGIKIRPVVLEYPVEDKDFCKKMDYQDETSFIISHQSRLTKVSKLTAGLPGTTLLLVSRRDDHAVPLYDEIKKYSKKPVYFVAGTVDAEDREEIRLKANTEDCIIVATYKTMSTGTNIPNIRNVVFGSTSKAMITILQSIGRGLRLHSDKESMLLIDFIDDLRYKKHENYAYQHSEVRMRIYRKEQFEISQPVKVML